MALTAPAAAQHLLGFGPPGRPLLSQRSGFVLGLPGLQGGLLGQLQRFDRGGWSAMIALEGDGQFASADVDVGAAAGPALVQAGVDADDLPDRPLGRVAVEAFGEPDAEIAAEVLLQRGVVGLRRRHLRLEQHPPINRQPAPVQGLHLVRHRHMGVQIRITGPAVPMGERGRHQAADVDLPDPLRTGPGEQRLLLNEPQRIPHRGLMGLLDDRRDGGSERPPTASTRDLTGEKVRS